MSQFKKDIEAAQRAYLKFLGRSSIHRNHGGYYERDFLDGFEEGWKYSKSNKKWVPTQDNHLVFVTGPFTYIKGFGIALGSLIAILRFSFKEEDIDRYKEFIRHLKGELLELVQKIIEELKKMDERYDLLLN